MIALIATIVAVWAILRQTPQAVPETEAASTVQKNNGQIDLPGYGSLSFRANVKEQAVRFPNPEANTCWVKMSLYLEDGTLLWESDLVAPGDSTDSVVFNRPLEAGNYENAVLKYDCFRMNEERSQVNGATVVLTLKVQ